MQQQDGRNTNSYDSDTLSEQEIKNNFDLSTEVIMEVF